MLKDLNYKLKNPPIGDEEHFSKLLETHEESIKRG